uniref:hypothetical protein n=1 Tax=Paractinoplanes polyasparticus TaxID=2856853 RepID=UPI001C85A165|nr:hypothetical protein [Actinoplanes polyasparticus]
MKPITDLRTACADCIAQLTHLHVDVLDPKNRTTVLEHLALCPDCSTFAGQLQDADALLQFRSRDIPRAKVDGLPPTDEVKEAVSALQEIAASLDAENADDLVQDVLSDALAAGDSFELAALTRSLIDRVDASGAPPVRTVTAPGGIADPQSLDVDADADTPELFYPAFYTDGPDIGRFVEAPNQWGGDDRRLGPESDLITAELLDEVDDALDRLPRPAAQVGRLVLIDGFSVEAAAGALRLPVDDTAAALHRARVHLRGVVDSALA